MERSVVKDRVQSTSKVGEIQWPELKLAGSRYQLEILTM